jgi:hypothetical protein
MKEVAKYFNLHKVLYNVADKALLNSPKMGEDLCQNIS